MVVAVVVVVVVSVVITATVETATGLRYPENLQRCNL